MFIPINFYDGFSYFISFFINKIYKYFFNKLLF